MSANSEYSVILVQSISQAMRIEAVLRQNKLKVRLIPVPRHLNSNCGSAVRIEKTAKIFCQETLAQAGISPVGFADLRPR